MFWVSSKVSLRKIVPKKGNVHYYSYSNLNTILKTNDETYNIESIFMMSFIVDAISSCA